jgi:hypothetical protein
MCLLKKLTIVTLILGICSTSGFAAEKSENSALNAEQVAKMSCSTAAEQLKAKIEMIQQLGYAYLQTYQALGDVYALWGEKLTKLTSLNETSSIGTFFLNSAATTKNAIIQSSKVVEDLNLETSLLMSRVIGCIDK